MRLWRLRQTRESRGCELMRAVEDGRFGYKYRPGDLLNSNPFSSSASSSSTFTYTPIQHFYNNNFSLKTNQPPPSFKMFKALIVALAAVAAAIPTQHPGSNEQKCGAGAFCCNSGTVGPAGIPIDVARLTCNNLNVVAIDALHPPTCNEQTVCCNNVQQNVSIQDQLSRKSITTLTKWHLQGGLVNVACSPIAA